MEIDAALRTRRSVRHFTDDPVAEGVIQDLLDAAVWAPSGGNEQPWRVTALRPPTAATVLAQVELRAWFALMPKLWSLVERARGADLAAAEALPAAREMVLSEGKSRGAPWLLLFHAEDPVIPPARIDTADSWLGTAVDAAHRPDLAQLRAVQGPIQDGVTFASTMLFVYNVALLAHARGLGACINHSLIGAQDAIAAALARTDLPPIVSSLLIGHPDPSSAVNQAAPARARRRAADVRFQ